MEVVNMAREFNRVMERIKNLTEYEVMVPFPKDFEFGGVVPYDMSISGNFAFVKVVAESLEEATFKANEYFESKYK
jgi:hypothetical protein